jgi:hypothetical protein
MCMDTIRARFADTTNARSPSRFGDASLLFGDPVEERVKD